MPNRAQLALGAAIVLLISLADVRQAIGFSSFGVLVYHVVAQLSALWQPAEQRRFPRALDLLGLVGCVVLVVTLPKGSLVTGALVLVVGLASRTFVLPRRIA